LASVLKKHLPLTGVTVTKEAEMPEELGGNAGSRKMDITVRADGGYERYIDVAIAEPSGSRVVELGSWEEPLRAAQDREDQKINFYRANAPLLEEGKLIPFVFESSGRPGKRAKEFMRDSGLPGAIVRSLYERISVILAHFGGMMITDLGRKRMGHAGG
jgi:hypothetical protein